MRDLKQLEALSNMPNTGAARFTRLCLDSKGDYRVVAQYGICHASMRYAVTGLKDVGWFNYYPGPPELVEPYIQWITDPNHSPWRSLLEDGEVEAFYSEKNNAWCVFIGGIEKLSSPAIMSFLKTSRLFTEHVNTRGRFQRYLNAGLTIPISYFGAYTLPEHGQFISQNIHGAPIGGRMSKKAIDNFFNGVFDLKEVPYNKNTDYTGTDKLFGPIDDVWIIHHLRQFLVVQNAPKDPNAPSLTRRFGKISAADNNAGAPVPDHPFDDCLVMLQNFAKEYNLADQ